MALLLAVWLCIAPVYAYASAAPDPAPEPEIFSDVPDTAWYAGVVQTACAEGLMRGVGDGLFSPDSELTLAQAVCLCARLHAAATGAEIDFIQGEPWYSVYWDYARSQDLLPGEALDGREGESTLRYEMAWLFSAALPELESLRDVQTLPDVGEETPAGSAIFRLYTAGVLSGCDAYGSFLPYAPVTRAETAAIVCRAALPELREQGEIRPVPAYIPGVENEDILALFRDVAFEPEYGQARAYCIKYTDKVYYTLLGDFSEDDRQMLDTLTQRLNSIAGFPGIAYIQQENPENLENLEDIENPENLEDLENPEDPEDPEDPENPELSGDWGFIQDTSDLYTSTVNCYLVSLPGGAFSSVIGTAPEGVWGYSHLWRSGGNILRSCVLLSTEIPTQLERDSILAEELLQSMGLMQDTWRYPESIFYQNNNLQGQPTEMDWAVLSLLYAPELEAGLPKADACYLARRILFDWCLSDTNT